MDKGEKNMRAAQVREKKERKSTLREYLEAFLIALIIALFIRTFIVQAFKIPSGSMESTLLVGDHIFVNKFIYGFRIPFLHKRVFTFHKPERGDVIVFIFPEDRSKDFIKRVVGIPGDKIEVNNKKVYVNGEAKDEPYVQYLDNGKFMPRRDNYGPVEVPIHKLFVMGDNRDKSYDSRFWGFVDINDVLGKAFVIYFSVKKDPGFHIYQIWRWPSISRWERIGHGIN
jgi:signal peptidase I